MASTAECKKSSRAGRLNPAMKEVKRKVESAEIMQERFFKKKIK
jgi:hypothetical protein